MSARDERRGEEDQENTPPSAPPSQAPWSKNDAVSLCFQAVQREEAMSDASVLDGLGPLGSLQC